MRSKVAILLVFSSLTATLATTFANPNTQIRMAFGNSSNPAQSMQGVNGSFSQFLPVWRQPFFSRDSVTFTASLGADIRRFNDEIIASNADFTLMRGELAVSSNITPLLTGGVRLIGEKINTRIASSRIGNTHGESNDISAITFGIFGGNKWGNWEWQIETLFTGRDFDLTSYEDKENIVLDDHKDFKKILRLVYDPPGDLKIELNGMWNDRRYLENSTNPESQNSPIPRGYRHPIEFLQEDYALVVIPELDDFAAETAVSGGWDIDRTNGSTTQKRARISQKFEFPFWKRRLRFVPTFDVLFRHFPDLVMPFLPVPRSDTLITASASLIIPFGKQFEAGFRAFRLGSSSNDLPHNYLEDGFQTELAATF